MHLNQEYWIHLDVIFPTYYSIYGFQAYSVYDGAAPATSWIQTKGNRLLFQLS